MSGPGRVAGEWAGGSYHAALKWINRYQKPACASRQARKRKPVGTVNTYTFSTTPDEEQEIYNNADAQGGFDGGWCTVATSSAINGIGPFSNFGVYFSGKS